MNYRSLFSIKNKFLLLWVVASNDTNSQVVVTFVSSNVTF